MAYAPTNWTNFPSTATPVNANNLNKIETELVALDTGKADESTVTTALAGKVDKVAGKGLSTNDYDNTAKGIVDGVTSELAGKVDKVTGKGLSTEDFTTAEKTKLAGISAQANKVEITPVVTEGTTLATISIDGVDTDIKGSDIDVDDEMSPISPNPVQNKVIYDTLQNILPEETAEGNPISITDASGLSAKSCEVTFSPIQSGSGDPSPENVRPISGRDGFVLGISGINVFDKDGTDTTNGYESAHYLRNDGTTKSASGWFISEYIKVGSSLSISGLPTSDASAPSLCFYDFSKTYISSVQYSNREKIENITIPDNAVWFRISCLNNPTTVQVEYSQTATAYEPYQGETHTATFPDTVYGGKVVWKDGVVKAIIDTGIITLNGTKTWATTSSNAFYIGITEMANVKNADGKCDKFKVGNYENSIRLGSTTTSNNRLYFTNAGGTSSDMFADSSAWETWLQSNNVTVTFPLAIPQEITLTPETIELLKGNNTLWTDGDNIKLVYSADIKQWTLNQLQS